MRPAPNPARVLWVPADPAEGSVSMDRHWRELELQRRLHPPADFLFDCALGAKPPENTGRAGRVGRAWRKYLAYPWTTRRWATRADIVHVLDHSFAHLLRAVPASTFKVVTVHDLAPLRDSSGLTRQQVRRFRLTVENLRSADLLLAVSRYTADDVAEKLSGDLPRRVQVLPMGVDAQAFAKQQARPPWWPKPAAGRPRAVLLSVGSIAPRKNLELLPRIFRFLKAAGRQAALVRVGQQLPEGLAASIRSELGPDGLIEAGAVAEEELIAIYQHADALIFPSVLEGFGLPVLEAMAAGCPVVCSNASSLPEVGGNAALYFSPEDAEQAAALLVLLLSDDSLRSEKIAAGREQALRLSWEQHWDKLLDFYRSARK